MHKQLTIPNDKRSKHRLADRVARALPNLFNGANVFSVNTLVTALNTFDGPLVIGSSSIRDYYPNAANVRSNGGGLCVNLEAREHSQLGSRKELTRQAV